MNLKSRAIMVVVIAGLFAITALITCQGQAQADESRIIRIYAESSGMGGGVQGLRVEPKNLWVRPGTTLIWNNWARNNISINFKEGTTCDLATQSKAGFILDTKTSCVVTNQDIPNGGTASMMFNKPGRFDYEIKVAGKKIRNAGSITVRPVTAEQ